MKMDRSQARLRLVKSDDLDLCSSYSFSAASPRGSLVRPHSISLTEDGASPTREPISANVIPMERRSVIREAHVIMRPSVRESVDKRQRLPVTEFRDNGDMPRPKDMPDDLNTVGKRVRWWREKVRKMSRVELAKKARMAPTTLADLENDRQDGSRKLHLIAAGLRLKAHYVETGKGEPEEEYAQESPEAPPWPFPSVPVGKLDKLNLIERKYAEDRLLEALAQIESERRKGKRTG